MVRRVLTTARTNSLRKHVRSVQIYGDEVEQDFVDAVATDGILSPLILAADGKTIVSGHRRWQSAKILGIVEVPVVVDSDLKDELTILKAILEHNRQRVKTPEMIGREAKALLEVESALAAKRQRAGLKVGASDATCVTRKTPDKTSKKPDRADERVGKELGVSRRIVRDSIEVVDAIDKAEAAGDSAKAEEIRSAKTVHAARQAANGETKEEKEEEPEWWEEWAAKHKRACNAINKILRDIKEIVEYEEGEYLAVSETRIRRSLEDAKTALWQLMPVSAKGRKITTRQEDQRKNK